MNVTWMRCCLLNTIYVFHNLPPHLSALNWSKNLSLNHLRFEKSRCFTIRTEEDTLKEYVRVIDSLTINQEHTLKKKAQDLESQKTLEIAVLKARLELQEEFTKGYRRSAEGFVIVITRWNLDWLHKKIEISDYRSRRWCYGISQECNGWS
jgi:hypothetical protein